MKENESTTESKNKGTPTKENIPEEKGLKYEAHVVGNNGENVKIDLESVPVTVRNIKFEGICRTRNDYIENSIHKVFKAKSFGELMLKIGEAQQTLRNLEAFAEVGTLVDTSKAEDAKSDEYEITFLLKEAGRIKGNVQTDVGSNEASAKAGLIFPNIFGRGEKILLNHSVSSASDRRSELTFSKPYPYFMRSNLSSSLSHSISPFPWSGFNSTSLANILTYSLKFANRDTAQFQFLGIWRHLTPSGLLTSSAVREHCGQSFKSSAKFVYTSDKRDNPIFPTIGYSYKYTGEFAGLLGDARFIKNELDFQKSKSLFSGIVAQASFRGGFLLPLSSSRICCNISDHFFLGGDVSLRGYQNRGVGPRSGSNALGGKAYWCSAIHLFCPLPFSKRFSFSDSVRTHVFLNAGSLVGSMGDESLMEPRVACGFGLTFRLLNIGKAELNYVIPLKYQKTDLPKAGLTFSFGGEFL